MPEELSRAVAEEINRLLAEHGWSARELARRTGITQASMSRKLNRITAFDLDDLQLICRAFDVAVSDLLSWAQRH